MSFVTGIFISFHRFGKLSDMSLLNIHSVPIDCRYVFMPIIHKLDLLMLYFLILFLLSECTKSSSVSSNPDILSST